MQLDGLIRKCFCNSGELAKMLTTFGGSPAVFSPSPPNDNDRLWGDRMQYPRIVFNFDMQANEERKSIGVLDVSLLCQNTSTVFPEHIEPFIRKCLRDVLLQPDSGHVYAFSWSRTDAFEMEKAGTGLLIGCDIRFDIHEYTSQQTTDPDPVMAASQFVKGLFPDAVAIGLEPLDAITVASPEKPVLFCELTEIGKAEETNNVAWMDGRIAIHILCPDSSIRKKMAAATVNRISLDGEITMLDHSPMFVKDIKANFKSDYLKDGLVFLVGHYGLLRYRQKHHRIASSRPQAAYSGKGGLNNGRADLADY